MAPLLGPGEEAWQGAFDNLSKRFSEIDASVVADTLRENEGHAGRTAQALRKWTPAAQPASAPKKPSKSQAAVTQTSAPSPTPVKSSPEPAKEECSTAAASTVETPPESEVAAVAGPPPPDSKLIFVAALQGDVQQLLHLRAAGADLNGRYTGRPNKEHADKIIDATPLHLVVTRGQSNIAEVLLQQGADFEAKMRRALGSSKPPEEQYAEMTPLHLAAMEGHTNIVEMLLARGANKGAVMQVTEHNWGEVQERAMTPLDIAHEMAAKGHPRDSVISLLNK